MQPLPAQGHKSVIETPQNLYSFVIWLAAQQSYWNKGIPMMIDTNSVASVAEANQDFSRVAHDEEHGSNNSQ